MTIEVVLDVLRDRLSKAETWIEQAIAWDQWIKDWDQFDMDTFLRSKYEFLVESVQYATKKELEPLKDLLPWPEAALNAYSVYNYELDYSMVTLLRYDLGHYWTPHMHCICGGMSKLPNSFLKETTDEYGRTSNLYPSITFNHTVKEIVYTSTEGNLHDKVVVTGTYTTSGETFSVEGNAVIITIPLNMIRKIRITPEECTGTKVFPKEIQKIIKDVCYAPATKIMIQSKTRFWEKMNITGGFSITNRPIGLLYYPTNTKENPIIGDKGILLCYIWKSEEALSFGSMPCDLAIKETVQEIAEIHPEIKDNFEVGAVQAWGGDDSSHGAFVAFKACQHSETLFGMLLPWCNIYFAGESISFVNDWIQGALQSSLRAAYQFYARNEKDLISI